MTIHRVVEFVYQSYCREQEVANKTALLLSFGTVYFHSLAESVSIFNNDKTKWAKCASVDTHPIKKKRKRKTIELI